MGYQEIAFFFYFSTHIPDSHPEANASCNGAHCRPMTVATDNSRGADGGLTVHGGRSLSRYRQNGHCSQSWRVQRFNARTMRPGRWQRRAARGG